MLVRAGATVSSEMVSGPDLGAGFLHQLSFDSGGEATTFTYHAQDGGSDAGGPPRGSLDPFGFVRPKTPCMFGGPRCWHRRFALPRSESLRVRQAYNRNRFVLAIMVDQVYGEAPVPVDRGIEEVVARLAGPLAAEGIEWYIGGSAAAYLQGARIRPRDLDLGGTRAGVDRIAGLLTEYLIEPLAPTDWAGIGIVRGARAFVGTLAEGLRVEWAVPLDTPRAGPGEEWSGRPEEVRRATVTVGHHDVWVSRPEYALVRAAEKQNIAHRKGILELLANLGTDRELLSVLLARSSLTPEERDRLRREAGG